MHGLVARGLLAQKRVTFERPTCLYVGSSGMILKDILKLQHFEK